jgi:hypothetical protein
MSALLSDAEIRTLWGTRHVSYAAVFSFARAIEAAVLAKSVPDANDAALAPLHKLLEYAELSNDTCYGVLSTGLVELLVKESIAAIAASQEQPTGETG